MACVEPNDEVYAKTSKRDDLAPTRYHFAQEMFAKHLENLRDLYGCGLPVLLEQPLESSFAKICDVVRWASRYDAPIVVDHCLRYSPILQEAKKHALAGRQLQSRRTRTSRRPLRLQPRRR